MKRPVPARVRIAARRIGENLSAWRRMLGLTSEEMADKASVSRDTISRLENGDPSVSMSTFLAVLRACSILDLVEDATDPYQSDLGRARADQLIPQRVRSQGQERERE